MGRTVERLGVHKVGGGRRLLGKLIRGGQQLTLLICGAGVGVQGRLLDQLLLLLLLVLAVGVYWLGERKGNCLLANCVRLSESLRRVRVDLEK